MNDSIIDRKKEWKAAFIIGSIMAIIIFVLGFVVSKLNPPAKNNADVAVEKPLTDEEKIKNIVNRQMSNEITLKNLKIDNDQGKYVIAIGFALNDFISLSSANSQINSTIENIYYSLYSDTKAARKISSVIVSVYMPMLDKYGNKSIDSVETTVLDAEDGYKINFDGDENTIKHQILPGLIKVINIHPDLTNS